MMDTEAAVMANFDFLSSEGEVDDDDEEPPSSIVSSFPVFTGFAAVPHEEAASAGNNTLC